MILGFWDVEVWRLTGPVSCTNPAEKVKPQWTEKNFPDYLHSFHAQTPWCLKTIQSLLTREFPGMLWNWVVLSEVHPCACELLGCVNGEEIKWGNVVGFFFKGFLFLSFGVDFAGRGCIFTLLFLHEYVPKSYCNMWCHFRGWRGWRGMPFSGSFSAFPWGWCCSSQFIFPVQLWLCNTKFSWCADILIAERWLCH